MISLHDQRDQRPHTYFAFNNKKNETKQNSIEVSFLKCFPFPFPCSFTASLLSQVAEEDLYSFPSFPIPIFKPHRTVAGTGAKMIGNVSAEKENYMVIPRKGKEKKCKCIEMTY